MAAQKFTGAATQTQLTAGVGDSDALIIVDNGASYPPGNFTIVIDRGAVKEEKVFVGTNSGNQFAGCIRGFDGTTKTDHAAHATVEHCVTADWFQRMDDFINTGVRDLTPAGVITAFAGSTAPPLHKLCDGASYNSTDPQYAALYAVIGTTYNTSVSLPLFQVPNLKGRVIVMRDAAQSEFDAIGEAHGLSKVALSPNELAAHQHTTTAVADVGVTITDPGHGHGQDAHKHNIDHGHGNVVGASSEDHGHGFSTSDQGGHDHGAIDADGSWGFLTSKLEAGIPQGVDAVGARSQIVSRTGTTPNHNHGGSVGGRTGAGTHIHGTNPTSGQQSVDGGNSVKNGTTAVTAKVTVPGLTTVMTSASVPHENMPPYLVLNYIIRL